MTPPHRRLSSCPLRPRNDRGHCHRCHFDGRRLNSYACAGVVGVAGASTPHGHRSHRRHLRRPDPLVPNRRVECRRGSVVAAAAAARPSGDSAN